LPLIIHLRRFMPCTSYGLEIFVAEINAGMYFAVAPRHSRFKVEATDAVKVIEATVKPPLT